MGGLAFRDSEQGGIAPVDESLLGLSGDMRAEMAPRWFSQYQSFYGLLSLHSTGNGDHTAHGMSEEGNRLAHEACKSLDHDAGVILCRIRPANWFVAKAVTGQVDQQRCRSG